MQLILKMRDADLRGTDNGSIHFPSALKNGCYVPIILFRIRSILPESLMKGGIEGLSETTDGLDAKFRKALFYVPRNSGEVLRDLPMFFCPFKGLQGW